jgi:hypothetical protein
MVYNAESVMGGDASASSWRRGKLKEWKRRGRQWGIKAKRINSQLGSKVSMSYELSCIVRWIGGRLRARLRRFGMHKRAGRARRMRAYGCRSAGEADRLR